MPTNSLTFLHPHCAKRGNSAEVSSERNLFFISILSTIQIKKVAVCPTYSPEIVLTQRVEGQRTDCGGKRESSNQHQKKGQLTRGRKEGARYAKLSLPTEQSGGLFVIERTPFEVFSFVTFFFRGKKSFFSLFFLFLPLCSSRTVTQSLFYFPFSRSNVRYTYEQESATVPLSSLLFPPKK